MKFGIHIPNFGPYADIRRVANLARDAEHAGWDGFFIWDHIATEWPGPVADVTIALAAIALSTSRLRLGALVTPLSRRHPAKFARESASLDHLSGGRMIVGVGLGSGAAEEFANLGYEDSPKTRAAMLDEALEVVSGLWRDEPFSFQGTHYTILDARFTPRPVQEHIPIWVGGTWPKEAPFRRAARYDGVFPLWAQQSFDGMMPAEEMRALVTHIRTLRELAGQNRPFDVIHWGITPAQGGTAVVQPYAEVGVTWWLENISPWRFGSGTDGNWPLEAMRERVLAGPPRE